MKPSRFIQSRGGVNKSDSFITTKKKNYTDEKNCTFSSSSRSIGNDFLQ